MNIGLGIVGLAFSMLLAGNIFFIKRLVDKIDKAEEVANEAKARVAVFEKSINGFVEELHGFVNQLTHIRNDLKGIHELDKSLAKIDAQLHVLLMKDGYKSGHG